MGLAAGLLVLIAGATAAQAVTLRPGDIVLIDTNAKAIVRVDPVTGQREAITRWKKKRFAPQMSFPWDVAIDAEQRILVADMNARAIFAIDAESGSQSVLSGRGVGSGPEFRAPRGIASDGAGGLYAADAHPHAPHRIYHIDLATGDRRVISGPEVGGGPPLVFPHDLEMERAGSLLVNVKPRSALYRVDPSTGDRSIVSSPDVGRGPGLQSPFGLAILADGDAVVTDREHATLVRVDTQTGDRKLLASPEVGSGPALRSPWGVAEAADGRLFVADLRAQSVYRVEPETGERSVLSSATVGSGDPLRVPRSLALVPSPRRAPRADFARRAGGAALLVAVALVLVARWRRPEEARADSGGSEEAR